VSLVYPQFKDAFARLLAACVGRRIAVLGHARPDGDCIGSQVALTRVLRSLGLDAVCCNPDAVPRRLRFLVGDTPFVSLETALGESRAALYVDCADARRATERFASAFPAPIGCVDHHLSNIGFAEINLIDTASSATGEILAGIFLDAGLPLDQVTAMALYTGIATDTGQFRFSATTRTTFLIAAELVARGADPARMGLELYEQESIGKLKLLQHFLASLELSCDGRVCIGVVPDSIYRETGTGPEDVEGVVDYARSIEGVEIGVFIEVRPGAIKASLRAKDAAFRVDRIAAEFTGGGHACAAGLNIKDEPLETFLSRLRAALCARVEAVAAARRSTLPSVNQNSAA
jgi:bifunctional oligoribonuclease and PAP phosphatase NrnA